MLTVAALIRENRSEPMKTLTTGKIPLTTKKDRLFSGFVKAKASSSKQTNLDSKCFHFSEERKKQMKFLSFTRKIHKF